LIELEIKEKQRDIQRGKLEMDCGYRCNYLKEFNLREFYKKNINALFEFVDAKHELIVSGEHSSTRS